MRKKHPNIKSMYSFTPGEYASTQVMNTLAIYEIKDGKLWRVWAFPPFLGGESAAPASESVQQNESLWR